MKTYKYILKNTEAFMLHPVKKRLSICSAQIANNIHVLLAPELSAIYQYENIVAVVRMKQL